VDLFEVIFVEENLSETGANTQTEAVPWVIMQSMIVVIMVDLMDVDIEPLVPRNEPPAIHVRIIWRSDFEVRFSACDGTKCEFLEKPFDHSDTWLSAIKNDRVIRKAKNGSLAALFVPPVNIVKTKMNP
jgi:hypothetical protein